ncbi:MAG: hypothetical protein IPL46_23555 [Saprospiraceae bacterium]|nr:hypothetical protein [Saprospiraceae bacterium]
MIKADIRHFTGGIRKILGSLLLLFISLTLSRSQDGPQRVFMYLDYFQSENGQYLLAEVKYRVEGEFTQLSDVAINFYLNTDTSQIKLGTVITGLNGKARFELNEDNLIRNVDGSAKFESIFEGNEGFSQATKDVTTKRVNLSLEGETEDSINTLTVSGIELINGEEIEVSETDISIFVKRTYSDLPIAEGTLEDGSFSTEFPEDLPGDDSGNLWIIARIIDHDDYGTVETRKQLAWGIPVSHVQEAGTRELWTRDAPLWIIMSVTLAFTAAWFHYFLSISKLFKIRKL